MIYFLGTAELQQSGDAEPDAKSWTTASASPYLADRDNVYDWEMQAALVSAN